jgi:tetratricopeptide (TPR) repeat protein
MEAEVIAGSHPYEKWSGSPWEHNRLTETVSEHVHRWSDEGVEMNHVDEAGNSTAKNATGATLEEAIRLQKSGQLDDAEQIYQVLLKENPQNAKAWHFAGVAAYQRGDFLESIERISRAIAIQGDVASFHCNLGLAYRAVNKIDEAIESFQRSLKFRPDNPVAFNNLGVIKLERGEAEDAAFFFRQSAQLRSGDAETRVGLGKALRAQKKLEQAIEQFELALQDDPNYLEGHLGLGLTRRDQGEVEHAIECFHKVIELDPEHAVAHNYLGAALTKLERYEEAEESLRRSIEIDPGKGTTYSNLGVALMEQRRLDEAEEAFEAASSVAPDLTSSLGNLGALYLHQGNYAESIDTLRRALVIQPDNVDAHWNRALAYLSIADFERGWAGYEWRRLRARAKSIRIPKPLWDGSSLGERRLLLHAEQGLGDTIQFIRYAKQIKAWNPNASIILACQKPIVPMLTSCEYLDEVVEQSKEQPLRFDFHAPLLSLPAILGTNDEESIPNEVPYMDADPTLIHEWSDRLERIDGLKVGIGWQGNSKFGGDRERSIPLHHFANLARLDDVRLISLQKGFGVEQIEGKSTVWSDDRLQCNLIDGSSEIGDWQLAAVIELDEQTPPFMETAAIMRNLDLVITSDSAVAHLAGALGVPTWTALPFTADWRWLTERSDSPWYPTMRLFRQRTRGDWNEVFQIQLASALRDFGETNSGMGSK